MGARSPASRVPRQRYMHGFTRSIKEMQINWSRSCRTTTMLLVVVGKPGRLPCTMMYSNFEMKFLSLPGRLHQSRDRLGWRGLGISIVVLAQLSMHVVLLQEQQKLDDWGENAKVQDSVSQIDGVGQQFLLRKSKMRVPATPRQKVSFLIYIRPMD